MESKQLKDYLNQYWGCQVVINPQEKDKQIAVFIGYVDEHRLSARVKFRAGPEGRINLIFIKPILRKLSSMTGEYFLSLFKMVIGCYEDMSVTDCKRHSTLDLYIRLGYGQFIFGFCKHPKPDVRVDEGYAIYIKRYQIEDRIEVTPHGVNEYESHYNKETLEVAFNQTTVFNKLRKDGYDIDGLIESGLAIDAETIQSIDNQNIKQP